MSERMKRREFITLLGGAAAWPIVATAQQGKRMRRVGVLMPYAANDPQAHARNAAFLQGLQQLAWTVGNNVEIDYRWSGGNEDDTRRYAAELVALAPDVILRRAVRRSAPCNARHAPYQSYSHRSPIQSERGSLSAWHGRVATLQALPRLSTGLAQNGWSCSSRLPPA